MVAGTSIPNYIKARSLPGLRRLMLRNNARLGFYFPYFDIQFVKGHWYAFYMLDIMQNVDDELREGEL